jgi:hypothetical protein
MKKTSRGRASSERDAFFNQYYHTATAEELYCVDPGRFKSDPEYREGIERRTLANLKASGPLMYVVPVDGFTRAKDQVDWVQEIIAEKLWRAEQWEAQRREYQAGPPMNWDFLDNWRYSTRARKLRGYYNRFLRGPVMGLDDKVYRVFRAAQRAASKRVRPLLDELRGAPTPRPRIDLKQYRHDADYRLQIEDEVLCDGAAARVAREPKRTGSVLGLI